MSRRKEKYLVVDVETAYKNQSTLVYDIGFAVIDNHHNTYYTNSLLITEVFFNEPVAMSTAYYSTKIPQYLYKIGQKNINVCSFFEAQKIIHSVIDHFKIKKVLAYNMNFDRRALNNTLMYLTDNVEKNFFPSNIEFNCIWHMACQTICNTNKYRHWCDKNNKKSEIGNYKTNAETVYGFLKKTTSFEEAHTGLADVLIECEIYWATRTSHKKTNRKINARCWKIPQK